MRSVEGEVNADSSRMPRCFRERAPIPRLRIRGWERALGLGNPATSAAAAGNSSPATVAGTERVVSGVGGMIGAAALAMVAV